MADKLTDKEMLISTLKQMGIFEYDIIQCDNTIAVVTSFPEVEYVFNADGKYISHESVEGILEDIND